MPKHKELGTNGEQIAVIFLKNKGYGILCCNWRFGKKEVDIIAEWEDYIIFAEVKTRSNLRFGYPEEAVNAQKKNYLKAAAEYYFELYRPEKTLRFDIISILLEPRKKPEVLHIEDAFY